MQAPKWKLFLFVLLSLVHSACNSAGFKAPPQYKRKQGEGAGATRVVIQTVNIERANFNTRGRAEMQVTSSESATIRCLNCPADRLPLQFEEKANTSGSGKLYVAPFDHVYVTETQLCRITLQVSYASGPQENKNYGVYFCPVDQATGTRVCDKGHARSVCN
jgi:hypothetical protein